MFRKNNKKKEKLKQCLSPPAFLNSVDSIYALLKEAYDLHIKYLVDQNTSTKTEASKKYLKALTYVKNLQQYNNLGSYGHTILSHAAHFNAVDIIKFLIEEKKFAVDMPNDTKITPLMEASLHGNYEIVKYLVQHGANVNAKTNDGDSALLFAVEAGHLEIVKLLIENGADKYYVQPLSGHSLLRIAKLEARKNIVDYLVSLGISDK